MTHLPKVAEGFQTTTSKNLFKHLWCLILLFINNVRCWCWHLHSVGLGWFSAKKLGFTNPVVQVWSFELLVLRKIQGEQNGHTWRSPERASFKVHQQQHQNGEWLGVQIFYFCYPWLKTTQSTSPFFFLLQLVDFNLISLDVNVV